MGEPRPWGVEPATERDRRVLDWLAGGAQPDQQSRALDVLAPHKTLARALLFDAFLHRAGCLRKGTAESCRQCQRDLDWLASENERYIFSFVNICGLLKIGTAQTRRRFLSEVAVYAGQPQRFYLHPRVAAIGAGTN